MAGPGRPAKRSKLLDVASDSEIDAGVQLNGDSVGFKINEEYAKRFEHNKKREERQQLEEKFKGNGKRKREEEDDSEDEESSSNESEDDEAELATEEVDQEIFNTLQAIKNKDPRVYDSNVKFYKEFDAAASSHDATKKEKPMYLQDYHRQNLLAGSAGVDEDEEQPVQTYQDEQDQLKRELVGSMHAAGGQEKDEDEDEDDFMVAKSRPKHEDLPAVKESRPGKKITEDDIKEADKDPETFLSNFMAARAWLPGDGSRFQPLESDDSEDDARADKFEEAYNLRFEDPDKANETLQSFARDVGKYGVRRDEKSGRQKARERERERREAEKKEREEERARLRKLKVEEAQEKVQRIKDAAGLRGKELNLDEWRNVIEGDFDDDKWEQEMKRRFGEEYYAEEDQDLEMENEEEAGVKGARKPKKPRWDDDIDIGDLVPDFEKDEPDITLTDDEADGGAGTLSAEDSDEVSDKKKRKTKKDREKEKSDAKRAARKERAKIEEIVDATLPLQDPTLTTASSSKAPVVGFRYRETSPTSFGLSARDILFADDSALNSYAGLKKMAAFRDPEKKRRDKKKFSKKQRLRQWRKDTFGKADEPSGGFERMLGTEGVNAVPVGSGDAERRKKKRNKKKAKVEAASA